MPRLTIVLIAVVALLAGGLGATVLNKPAAPVTDTAAIRAVVSDLLAAHDQQAAARPVEPAAPAVAAIDAATLNPMIESYLMSDPKILTRLSQKLDTETRMAEAAASKSAIASMHDAIFNDPNQIVLGNPDGDVTLVEMFDYNCSYCRSALPDLATLLDEDKNLRVVLKEFPILSQGSLEAAKVAVLVGKAKVDYWSFHETMFTGSGENNQQTALSAAKTLGLSPVALQLDLATPQVNATLQTSYDIAKALNITGTPTYIIGNEVIPGAIGIDELRSRIKSMRACGETACAG
ncbi:DsbA family protein [Devosia sp.]|uniref:DsbA family protein n=1 Tax=Devosia sp. TaxID=1871048 RepID=UPI003265E542